MATRQPLESTVTKNIMDYLKRRGGVALKIAGGGLQTPGILDIYYAEDGVGLWFEVKRSRTGKYGVTKLQQMMIDHLTAQKIPVHVVYSVEDVRAVLATLRVYSLAEIADKLKP